MCACTSHLLTFSKTGVPCRTHAESILQLSLNQLHTLICQLQSKGLAFSYSPVVTLEDSLPYTQEVLGKWMGSEPNTAGGSYKARIKSQEEGWVIMREMVSSHYHQGSAMSSRSSLLQVTLAGSGVFKENAVTVAFSFLLYT